MTVHEEGKALVKAILDRKGVKLCKSCGLTKPFSEFQEAYTDKKGKKSYRHDCKECQNLRRREWRKRNHHSPQLERERDQTKKIVAEAQKETLAQAENYALQWTAGEDKFIMERPSLTNKELALELGRSYSAVCRRKTILRKRGLL